MSGGYFDYKQYQIEDIADKIENLISKNDSVGKNKYGDDISHHYSAETISKFYEAVKTLRAAGIMTQRIDWLESDDDSEKTFHQRWEEELSEYFNKIGGIK